MSRKKRNRNNGRTRFNRWEWVFLILFVAIGFAIAVARTTYEGTYIPRARIIRYPEEVLECRYVKKVRISPPLSNYQGSQSGRIGKPRRFILLDYLAREAGKLGADTVVPGSVTALAAEGVAYKCGP